MERSSEEVTTEAGICTFFQKGKCRFGDKCNFKHIVDETSNAEGQENKNNPAEIKNKSNQSEVKSTKKPPMKTARDVRQRLQWDESMKSENCTIGYLDRFLGVIEKPFSDFSWEDLASVDLTVLAIPEHRIQYFKYRGYKVWDKKQRLDYVFGSTGADKTIYDVMEEVDNAWAMAGLQKEQGEASGSASSTHEVLEKEPELKNKPTHFISVQIRCHEILFKLKEFQVNITKILPSLQNSCVPLDELHITLGTLCLPSVAEISSCCKLLTEIQEELLLQTDLKLPEVQVEGIGHFSNNTIHAIVNPDGRCQELNEFLVGKFLADNILINTNFLLHVTLFKAHKLEDKNMITKALASSVFDEFKNFYFGSQVLDTFCLCYVGSQRDPDGFYKRVCELKCNPLTIALL